jgi:putative membrane protein
MLDHAAIIAIAFHTWDWGAGSWLWMVLMMFFGIAALAIIVWAIIKVFGFEGGPGLSGRYPHATEPPLEIARRRYAAGEITKEQLDEIERTLKGG